jgi:hypothetical protein
MPYIGKSTLLKHISQRHLPIPAHIRILHVEQEVIISLFMTGVPCGTNGYYYALGRRY